VRELHADARHHLAITASYSTATTRVVHGDMAVDEDRALHEAVRHSDCATGRIAAVAEAALSSPGEASR
jgi:hypothetical protein